MFPMNVMKRSGRARTKDYHLILICNADNRAILIQRWGKARQWGHGWKLTEHESFQDAAHEFEKKCRQKFDGEYTEEIINKAQAAADLDELRKVLGLQYIDKIGKKLAFLIPGLDVSKLKDAEPDTEFDADGRKMERARRTFAPVPEPVEPVEDRVATQPLWGIWG